MARDNGGTFVIACGGTGGHLFPGLAVAEELRRRGRPILLLVSSKEIDAVALQEHPDYPRAIVDMVGMPRPWSPAMAGFLWRFARERARCVRLLRENGACAVLGMGGFTSTPPVLAGRRLGVPTFIHESNAVPGKANRLTARFASAVLLGMEECRSQFPRRAVHVVGTPIRSALRAPVDRAAAYTHFGLGPDRQTLLVMGGSQGASGINEAVARGLGKLDPRRVQCLHFSGARDEESLRQRYAGSGLRHHVAAFCGRMEYALAIADLAVCRSGASSLAELAFFGIPAVLIPYPFAADDHQTRNAEPYARRGAAVVRQQAELGGERLGEELAELMRDEEVREGMRVAMRDFSSADATIKICKLMEEAAA